MVSLLHFLPHLYYFRFKCLLKRLNRLTGFSGLTHQTFFGLPQSFLALTVFGLQSLLVAFQLGDFALIALWLLIQLKIDNICRLAQIILKRSMLFLHRCKVVSKLSNCWLWGKARVGKHPLKVFAKRWQFSWLVSLQKVEFGLEVLDQLTRPFKFSLELQGPLVFPINFEGFCLL